MLCARYARCACLAVPAVCPLLGPSAICPALPSFVASKFALPPAACPPLPASSGPSQHLLSRPACPACLPRLPAPPACPACLPACLQCTAPHLPRTLMRWGSGGWQRRAASGSCASSAWCEALARDSCLGFKKRGSGRQAPFGAEGCTPVAPLACWYPGHPIQQPTNSNLAVQHLR